MIFNWYIAYQGSFSIQCLRCSQGDCGGSVGGVDVEVDDTASQVGESLAREACKGFPLALYIFCIFCLNWLSSINSLPFRADYYSCHQNRSQNIKASIYLLYSVPSYGPFNVEVIRQVSETMSYKITGSGKKWRTHSRLEPVTFLTLKSTSKPRELARFSFTPLVCWIGAGKRFLTVVTSKSLLFEEVGAE